MGQATLITADPGYAFAYWQLEPDEVQTGIERTGPSAKLFLRFYDITTTNHIPNVPQWDVEIFDSEGNWYVKLEKASQKICFDIGLKNKHNEFVALKRSNMIHLTKNMLDHPRRFTADVAPTIFGSEKVHAPPQIDSPGLKRILGPYFFDLFQSGKLGKIAGTSLAALFNDIRTLARKTENPS